MSSTETIKNIERNKIVPPKRYAVFLMNDDYTTMDFVVDILMEVFLLAEQQAIAIMFKVHREGKGLCGIYTRDIAQTKQQQVHELSEKEGFPLMCRIEELE